MLHPVQQYPTPDIYTSILQNSMPISSSKIAFLPHSSKNPKMPHFCCSTCFAPTSQFDNAINAIIMDYSHLKGLIMEKQLNQNSLYSFIVLPSSLQYFAFVPITPTTPENPTPNSEMTLASSYFNSGHFQQLYCRSDSLMSLPQGNSSFAEARVVENQFVSEASIEELFPIISQHPSILKKAQSNPNLDREPQRDHNFSLSPKKQKSSSRPLKQKEEDLEYQPRSGRKKQRYVKYHQNQNRNIIPNEINQIFSFIQKHSKSGHIIQRLFLKFPHPTTYSVKRFYLYQKLLKNRLGHYTNENSLRLVTELYEPKCESWPEQEQRYYNKLCRVLIRHFLLEDSIFIILTSKRMKSQKKGDHLRARRKVSQSVMKILEGH